jgi:hypothetical protein
MCAAVSAQITKANLKARLLMRVLNVSDDEIRCVVKLLSSIVHTSCVSVHKIEVL